MVSIPIITYLFRPEPAFSGVGNDIVVIDPDSGTNIRTVRIEQVSEEVWSITDNQLLPKEIEAKRFKVLIAEKVYTCVFLETMQNQATVKEQTPPKGWNCVVL